MLARNRKSGDELNSTPESRPTIVVSRQSPAGTSYASPVEPETSAAESADEDAAAQPRRRSAKPRVAPDKHAVREHLQVFRQVANASARTAVAKHTSRRMWMMVAAKGIVGLVCVAAAASFLYASVVQQANYHWQALGCTVMGVAVGLDLLRMLYRTRRAVAKSKSPGQNTSSASADEESPALDDETEDEVAQNA